MKHLHELARRGAEIRARSACPSCKGRDLAAEVARLSEALEEIIGEPWLMGGRDACSIASAALHPPVPS